MTGELGELTWNKAGHVVLPITKDLFIGGDGKLYRGDINDPDDCPRCRWRNACPSGMPGLGTHRCNIGIFEVGNPEKPKPRWRPRL